MYLGNTKVAQARRLIDPNFSKRCGLKVFTRTKFLGLPKYLTFKIHAMIILAIISGILYLVFSFLAFGFSLALRNWKDFVKFLVFAVLAVFFLNCFDNCLKLISL